MSAGGDGDGGGGDGDGGGGDGGGHVTSTHPEKRRPHGPFAVFVRLTENVLVPSTKEMGEPKKVTVDGAVYVGVTIGEMVPICILAVWSAAMDASRRAHAAWVAVSVNLTS